MSVMQPSALRFELFAIGSGPVGAEILIHAGSGDHAVVVDEPADAIGSLEFFACAARNSLPVGPDRRKKPVVGQRPTWSGRAPASLRWSHDTARWTSMATPTRSGTNDAM